MPRFFGHYVGISFQAELLAMTLLGLLNSTLEWYPFDWTHQVEKIWNLSLSQHYFLFYTNFEYWIKTILTWVVITRKIVAYIYTFSYMVNFYPILTWSRPNLLLPWLILSFFQNFILKSIVITISLWLWTGERFSSIRVIEFIIVEFLSLITSAYIWYAIACSCIQLKRIANIRQIRKALQKKYSIAYDLFSSDGSSMEISKESSFGSSLGRHRHMSLPNLNEAFYRSIFSDTYSDNKSTRSLTTLSTINSFSDSEGFISQIVHNTDLMPAKKCMMLLGLTDVDVINARARVRKRMSTSYPRIEEEKKDHARLFKLEEDVGWWNDKTGKIRTIDSREMRGPSIVDYLMTKTAIPLVVSRTDDTRSEMTLEDVERNEDYAIREEEREIECFTPDKKSEELFIKDQEGPIIEPQMEDKFEQPQQPVVDIISDRTDEKEDTKLQLINKKKKKKLCPSMREQIESRPCFPLVGRRKFKECPFKKETDPFRCAFPCFSGRRNKYLNNKNFRATDDIACQDVSNDDTSSKDLPVDDSTIVNLDTNSMKQRHNFVQSESSANVTTMQELINKKSESYLALKESCDIETPNLPNVPPNLRLDPRRNFKYIFNSRSNVLPLTNVWSTLGCLPFRQNFNFTSLYNQEFQFDEVLFKPSRSQELLGKGRIAWKAPNTEFLVGIPEQIACYTGAEYKSVPIPGTSNGSRFVADKLQNFDSVNQESIKTHRYANIEYPVSGEIYEKNNPLYVSQGVLTDTRNFVKDNDTYNDRKKIRTQTTESIGNDEILRVADNINDCNMQTKGTSNIYPKFLTKMCSTSSFDYSSNIKNGLKNSEYSNISRRDSLENEFRSYKNSHHQVISENLSNLTLVRVANSSGYEKTSVLNKPPAYPKKAKKESLHRLTGVKNKITKVSFESNKHLEHHDRLIYDVESLKRRKRVTSSMEREQLEMKALRAYNEITLLEDKREMGEKKRRVTEAIYSFTQDTRGLKIQIKSGSKVQSKREAQERNEYEDLSNEIEISNTDNSLLEYITSFNNEKLSMDTNDINSSNPSCSRLPYIEDKDAAIMLNLLDRHGSHWFKQELRKMLATRNSQANVKHSEHSQDPLRLDLFLKSCQKIDNILTGHELGRIHGKEDISVPFQIPLSYHYLQRKSNLDWNRNLSTDTRDTVILSRMESTVSEVPINSADLTDVNENNEIREEKVTRTMNLLEEDELKNTEEEISKNGLINIEINNLSHHLTNIVPPAACTRTEEDAVESCDSSNYRNEATRRNIVWSLCPNGIVITNKNLQDRSLKSTNLSGNQHRDIVDDFTISLVHAAFTHKPEIIVRTLPFDTRSSIDQGNANERSASIFDDIYDTYRLMPVNDEFILRFNNETNVFTGATLTLPDIQESDDTLQSSYDSIETERNVDLYIVVMENDDLSLESISTSVASLPGDEVVEHDSVVIVTEFSETKEMGITDPRTDTSSKETLDDSEQPFLEMIIAFFSFLLACYIQYLRSYLSSMSDSQSSIHTYRSFDVHTDKTVKSSFPEESLHERSDVLAVSNLENNTSVSTLIVGSENEEGTGIIEFTDKSDNDDNVSVESKNQQVSSLRDSFDTTYSRSTVESENAISVGEGSSMEDFS